MYHLFTTYLGRIYYICSASENAHISTIKQIYENLYPKAQFHISHKHMGRLEIAGYSNYMCLNFAKKYKTSTFQGEVIGA